MTLLISDRVQALGDQAVKELAAQFQRIDAVSRENTARVLSAFQKHRVAESYFAGTTGYGYDDLGLGKLDEIYIVYTKIQNALTSEPVMERLLPLDREHLKPTPKGLGDPRGEVEMFPDAKTVFEQTAPIYMHGMIFGAMTESFCAEQSARMTAMDSATKSANDMIRDLQLEYNRTRQGSITQEITEIIGGAAAVQDRT